MKAILANSAKVLNRLRVAVAAALLICISFSGASAGQAEDLFSRGNRAYAEGKYDEALSSYERVIHETGYSAALLYNMANAYYRKKDVGQAVLHYERALYLDPGNADIQANLALARRDFGLVSDPTPSWQRPFNLLNLNGWTLIVSGAFGIFSLMLLLRGLRPAIFPRRTLRTVTTVSLLLLLTGGIGMTLQYRKFDRGVVTQAHTQLRVSPFDSADSPLSIENGKMVRMARTYRDYVLVKGENGQAGWIKKGAVQPVIPSKSCS